MNGGEKLTGAWYRCKHCQRVMWRDKQQAWVKSYCERTGRMVHLLRTTRSADTPQVAVVCRPSGGWRTGTT